MTVHPESIGPPIIRIGKADSEQPTLVLFDPKAAHANNAVVATGFFRGDAPVEPVALARPALRRSESPHTDPWADDFHETLTFRLGPCPRHLPALAEAPRG